MPIRAMLGTGTAAAAILAGHAWWLFAMWRDAYVTQAGSGFFQSAAALFALICCLRHSRFFSGGVVRNAWLYYALGAFLALSVELYGTFDLVFHGGAAGGPAVPGAMETIPFVLFMMALRHHREEAGPDSRIPVVRYYLDICIMTASFISLYWHYLLDPHLSAPLYRDSGMLAAFLGTGVVTAMPVGLLALALSGRTVAGVRVLVPLIASFGLMAAARFRVLHLALEGGGARDFFQADLAEAFGYLLLGISAALNGWDEMHRLGTERRNERRQGFSRIIPGIAIGVIVVAFTFGIRHQNALSIGTLTVIHLLLIRLWVGKRAFMQTERALSEAEEKYRNLVENSQVGVFSAQYGKLTYVNRYFAETFGYEPEEMVGTSFMQYISGEDRERLAMEIARLAMNHGFTPSIAVQGIKRDGSSIHLEVQATRTVQRGDVIITGTLIDITERKLAEEMVIRSEKLSVVGQLAAGVAHEIRNPLTSLRGFTQLLKARSQGDQNSAFYDIMLNELDRINYIVGEFMLLSRPQQMQQLEPHDLRELISSMLPIIETQAIIHNVAIHMDWVTPVKPVLCDKNQMKQVFMNVLKNAIEAMPDGGAIRIKFDSGGGAYTAVQITDEGPGMPAEVLARLGEPFFTTKKSGTGLGLMVCYRIIEAHNGKMTIRSEKGKGTTVEIQLRTAMDEWSRAMNI